MKILRLISGMVLLCASVPAAAQVNFTSSNLPIVVLEVDSEIRDEPKVLGHMGIIYNGEGVRNNLSDPFNAYDGAIGIEIRGSSSQFIFPKKSFAVETWEEAGGDRQVALLGFPKEEDWVLYGPYSDKTLMRNVLLYGLARKMGRYATRTQYVELVLNGEYRGVYVLMEKIKRDDNRVDVSRLNPEEVDGDDVTGGYIIKIDKTEGAEVGGWWSTYPPVPGSNDRVFYQYHDPSPSEIVPAQEAYIQGVIADFEAMMDGAQFADPQQGYPAYLDVDAAVDFFILNELSKNVDGYRLSTFMYKDKDSEGGKLVMGPVWDFNLGFGNADYYNGDAEEGFHVDYLLPPGDFQPPFWWSKLWHEETFNQAVRQRWEDLRQGVLHTDTLMQFIDETAAYLQEAQQRDQARWRNIGIYVWPNAFVGATYGAEVNYLKQWLVQRLVWIDANLSRVVATNPEPGVERTYALSAFYPNPSRDRGWIKLRLPTEQQVDVRVYDVLGRQVARLHEGRLTGGVEHVIPFSRADLAGGVYVIRVVGRDFSDTRRVVLVR